MSEIKLEHVSRVYLNDVEAVKDINLELKEKAFVVIAGEDGCGKSTLLRMIAGIEDLSGGKIYINGKCVNQVDAKDRGIAMVLENSVLYPDMSVRENLSFSLRLKKKTKQQIENAVGKIARLMKLEEILDKKSEELDADQTRKVIVARALVKEPEILLVDEPIVKASAEEFEGLAKRMAKIQEVLGITIIINTNDPEIVNMLNMNTIIMKKGAIMQYAPAKTLRTQPANFATAKFMFGDTMKDFRAVCQIKDGRISFKNDEGIIQFDEMNNHKLANYNKKEVLLGVCKDKIYVFDGMNEKSLN